MLDYPNVRIQIILISLMPRLTEEQVNQRIEELRSRGIELLEPYKGCDFKHNFKCKVCDIEWLTTWGCVINSKKGCPECKRKKIGTANKLKDTKITQRIQELKKRGIELLDPYKNSQYKNTFLCNCGHIWKTTFYSVWAVSNCPNCSALKRNKEGALTPIKIKNRIDEIKKRNISLLDSYISSDHKHNFLCDVCNFQWKTYFFNVYNKKSGCPKCAGVRVNKFQINEKIKNMNSKNIFVLEPYKGCDFKHKFLCKICNHKWSAVWYTVANGKSGCPKCAGRYLDETEINRRIQEIKQRNIQILEKYKSQANNYNWLCLICDHKWKASFNNIYKKKSGCPKCAGKVLTPEQKLLSSARFILRNRLRSLVKDCKLKEKPYKSNNIKIKQSYDKLSEYWYKQHKNFILNNPKPNKGMWHLDHIIPLSWFDPYSLEEMKLCWSAENLQWLSASENVKKHNNIRPIDVERCFTDWHWEALKKCSYPKHEVYPVDSDKVI